MSFVIEDFVDNARRFCDWIELDRHDVVSVQQLLLALLHKVPYLFTAETSTDDSASDDFPRREYDGWTKDVAQLADLPLQYYRVAFAPLSIDDDSTVVGDVCDDLADIYGDLWHGLQAFDAGATSYAVNYWCDSYRDQWGQHAIGAITAIDAYIRTNGG